MCKKKFDDDGIPDHLDPDSDGDGCNDVLEAGFTDTNGDGKIGGLPINVDADGKVTEWWLYYSSEQRCSRWSRLYSRKFSSKCYYKSGNPKTNRN